MRKYAFFCPHRKLNPYKRIAKAMKDHQVVANKLNREFKQCLSGKVLLTDITYLPYNETNIAYLSIVKDDCKDEILPCHTSNRHILFIATRTILKLKNNKKLRLHKDDYIHSYQGSHYTSSQFQKLLKKYNLSQSLCLSGGTVGTMPIRNLSLVIEG